MNYSKAFDWFFALFCITVAFSASPLAVTQVQRTLNLPADAPSSVFLTTP